MIDYDPPAKRIEEGDSFFDGFAYRPFHEEYDGWRNALPDPNDYPAVQQALAILDLFNQLTAARKKIWELEKDVARYKSDVVGYP